MGLVTTIINKLRLLALMRRKEFKQHAKSNEQQPMKNLSKAKPVMPTQDLPPLSQLMPKE